MKPVVGGMPKNPAVTVPFPELLVHASFEARHSCSNRVSTRHLERCRAISRAIARGCMTPMFKCLSPSSSNSVGGLTAIIAASARGDGSREVACFAALSNQIATVAVTIHTTQLIRYTDLK